MKNNKDLSELFDQARNEATDAPVSKITSLTEHAKPLSLASKPSFQPRRIRLKFNPLKILIMITTIVIITAALFNIHSGNKAQEIENKRIKVEQISQLAVTKKNEVLIKTDQPAGKKADQAPENNPDFNSGLAVIAAKTFRKDAVQADAGLGLSKEQIIQFEANQVLFENDSLPVQKSIKLKRDVLGCLGIEITTNRIDASYRSESYLLHWIFDDTGTRVEISLISFSDSSETIISSDQNRFIPISMSSQFDQHKFNSQCGLNMDLIIPVQLDDPTASPDLQNWVMWVYPNDLFFECLPPEIGTPLRKEFNYQLKKLNPDSKSKMGNIIEIVENTPPIDNPVENSEPVPCVYFTNLCETLAGLDYVNLYPNPATDKINIDLVLQSPKKIRYRVMDMGGRVISDDGAPENYPNGGKVTHQIDISKLQQGIYLMVMTDEQGARVTRRFVKQ